MGRHREERLDNLMEMWMPGTRPTVSSERSMLQIMSKKAKANIYLLISLMLSAAEIESRREMRRKIQSATWCQMFSPAPGTTGWHSCETAPTNILVWEKNCVRGTGAADWSSVPDKYIRKAVMGYSFFFLRNSTYGRLKIVFIGQLCWLEKDSQTNKQTLSLVLRLAG